MPRANRFFIPHHVWHITHRISILNYTVTSNHIHLLVRDNIQPSEIPCSMQLVAGRMAQEYNRRKGRKGAF
jgi:putative transposase